MTEENYQYRTSQTMLRNQFNGSGPFQIPIIPKPSFTYQELQDLLFIAFDRTNPTDQEHTDRVVHFFLYDYKFERVWREPGKDIERLRPYLGVLSPDFSMYLEMNRTIQLYNTFRNRWCGAYFAANGLRVIPTVNWGDETTFDFCFEGIEHGSPVAVSTYMVSEHGNHADQKDFFLPGYREMLQRIDPEFILCYYTPFPEMEGNIIPISYEHSSWRYLNYEPKATNADKEDLEVYKIGGATRDIYGIMEPYIVIAGSGSAYGGPWKPAKPEDERLLGNPGEVKVTTDKNGNKIETKIGQDGRAVKERHHTANPNPKLHSNPHDHIINWEHPKPGIPNFGKQINYWEDVPEFKNERRMNMTCVPCNSFEDNRFKTISEFVDSVIRGGEIVFEWNGVEYGICRLDQGIIVAEADDINEQCYKTPEDALEYMLGEDRLRDVVTQVKVWWRNV